MHYINHVPFILASKFLCRHVFYWRIFLLLLRYLSVCFVELLHTLSACCLFFFFFLRFIKVLQLIFLQYFVFQIFSLSLSPWKWTKKAEILFSMRLNTESFQEYDICLASSSLKQERWKHTHQAGQAKMQLNCFFLPLLLELISRSHSVPRNP